MSYRVNKSTQRQINFQHLAAFHFQARQSGKLALPWCRWYAFWQILSLMSPNTPILLTVALNCCRWSIRILLRVVAALQTPSWTYGHFVACQCFASIVHLGFSESYICDYTSKISRSSLFGGIDPLCYRSATESRRGIKLLVTSLFLFGFRHSAAIWWPTVQTIPSLPLNHVATA